MKSSKNGFRQWTLTFKFYRKAVSFSSYLVFQLLKYAFISEFNLLLWKMCFKIFNHFFFSLVSTANYTYDRSNNQTVYAHTLTFAFECETVNMNKTHTSTCACGTNDRWTNERTVDQVSEISSAHHNNISWSTEMCACAYVYGCVFFCI